MVQPVNKIFYLTLIIYAVFTKINEAAKFNIAEFKVEDDNMLQTESFSKIHITLNCTDLNCTGCLLFNTDNDHELCLIGGIKPQVIGAYILLNFDRNNVWKREVDFNIACVGVPVPLDRSVMCIELYNVTVRFPEDAAICFRAKLILDYPLISYNFTCISYEKGKGISFDKTAISESDALIEISTYGGKPKLIFNKRMSKEFLRRIMDLLMEQIKILATMPFKMNRQNENDLKEENISNEFWPSLGFGGVDYGTYLA